MAKIEIYIRERCTVLSLWTEDDLKRETKRHLSLSCKVSTTEYKIITGF